MMIRKKGFEKRKVSYMSIPGLKVRPKVAKLKIGNADYIEQVCKEFFKVGEKKFNLKSNKGKSILPRQVCMMFQKRYAGLTLKKIGDRYGNDHTTVMYAIGKVQELMDTDSSFRKKVLEIEQIIQKTL